MQIKITARGTDVTPSLRDYVHEKVGKLEQFFSNIQKIEVILEARSIDDANKRQVAEIRAWMAGLKFIQASEAGKDMYAAIDLVVEEVKRQLQKHKKKHVEEQRRKADKIKQKALNKIDPDEGKKPSLEWVDSYAKKPMDFAEAREELKISSNDFMVFRNLETKEINVVRKSNNNFELLRAEKEMTPEEAVGELQNKNQDLVFFNNKSSRIPSVVFRRKSGDFGVIEPEF